MTTEKAKFDEKVFAARYFREQLALEIQVNLPEVADDYKKGLTAKQIKEKYDIPKYFDYRDGRNIDTSILMALGGFKTFYGEEINGLIKDKGEYKFLSAMNQITKGKTAKERQNRAIHANNVRLDKLDIPHYSDLEKYLIWLGMNCDEFKDSIGRVRRNDLTQTINDWLFEGENVRNPTSTRNIMTQFTNARNRHSFYFNRIIDNSKYIELDEENESKTDEERYFVWLAINSPDEMKVRNGKIHRAKLLKIVNDKFFEGKKVRSKYSLDFEIKRTRAIRKPYEIVAND